MFLTLTKLVQRLVELFVTNTPTTVNKPKMCCEYIVNQCSVSESQRKPIDDDPHRPLDAVMPVT